MRKQLVDIRKRGRHQEDKEFSVALKLYLNRQDAKNQSDSLETHERNRPRGTLNEQIVREPISTFFRIQSALDLRAREVTEAGRRSYYGLIQSPSNCLGPSASTGFFLDPSRPGLLRSWPVPRHSLSVRYWSEAPVGKANTNRISRRA